MEATPEGIIPKQTLYIKNLYEKLAVTGARRACQLYSSRCAFPRNSAGIGRAPCTAVSARSRPTAHNPPLALHEAHLISGARIKPAQCPARGGASANVAPWASIKIQLRPCRAEEMSLLPLLAVRPDRGGAGRQDEQAARPGVGGVRGRRVGDKRTAVPAGLPFL